MTDTKKQPHTPREYRGWIHLTHTTGNPTYIQVRNIGEVYVNTEGVTCIETPAEAVAHVNESLDHVLDAIFWAEDGFSND